MIIDIQLNPATERWEALRDGALLAEDAGFGTVWVFDHFAGSLLRGSTMLECFTLLGAFAAATTRIGIGSLVVNIANRNPGVMAMAAASVQTISNGRLILGVGAGAAPNTPWSAEHRALGIELGPKLVDRHARLVTALDVMDDLWAIERAAHHETFPRPEVRPPVIIGINSVPLAEIAGQRCAGLNVRANHPDLELLLDAAQAARAASPLAGTPFDMGVWTHWDDALADPQHPDRRRWESLGVTRLVLTCLEPHDPAAVAAFLR